MANVGDLLARKINLYAENLKESTGASLTQIQEHEQLSWGEVIGQIILLLVLLKWSYSLFFPTDVYPWIFLDNANLLIHEGGHIIFHPLGDFMQVLGGSLTQVIVPLLFVLHFLTQMRWTAAAFSIFWLGDSMVNVSYYIGDARLTVLPLLNGDASTHDWNWILSRLHLLQYDTVIGNSIFVIGVVWIVLSVLMLLIDIYFSLRHIDGLQPSFHSDDKEE